jgi:hypothetical protein
MEFVTLCKCLSCAGIVQGCFKFDNRFYHTACASIFSENYRYQNIILYIDDSRWLCLLILRAAAFESKKSLIKLLPLPLLNSVEFLTQCTYETIHRILCVVIYMFAKDERTAASHLTANRILTKFCVGYTW